MADANLDWRVTGEGGSAARPKTAAGSFGPNAWLVDDMYDRFVVDPTSVSESWREFFADYRQPPAPSSGSPQSRPMVELAGPRADSAAISGSRVGSAPADIEAAPAVSSRPSAPSSPPAPTSPPAPSQSPVSSSSPNGNGPRPVVHHPPAQSIPEIGVPLRGAASRVAANMEASLGVPTATSVRTIPAKLLEINRQILNNQLARTSGAKVSFTHLIGYAVVRALVEVPALNATFVADVDGKGTP